MLSPILIYMNHFIQRIQSYLATPSQAQEKISDLLIELRQRGINFDMRLVDEDGKKYFYAQSVDYPQGHISATGRTVGELEQELKDAIFAAFEVPVRYSNSDLIVFKPPFSKNQTATASRKIYAST